MLFQINQICFNESDYDTQHSPMSIMVKNSLKMTQKSLQEWFQAIIMWYLSEKCYHKHSVTDLAV